MLSCPHCGGILRASAKFCSHCGHLLATHPAAYQLPSKSVSGDPSRFRRYFRGVLLFLLLFGILLGSGRFAWTTLSQPLSTHTTPTRIAVPTLPLRTHPTVAGPIASAQTALPIAGIGTLRVHFIDVEQGDSTLIQAPDGTTALIDGGYDNGLALQYLQAHGITHIDVMIASHPHADHIGGLVAILKAMPVGVVWASGANYTSGTYERFLDAIAQAKVPYREAKRGDSIPFGTLIFTVLHSELKARNLNDTSLVVHMTYGHISFLFTGDAEGPSEQAMLRQDKDSLRATILKVGHHGSYTSSSPAFLAAVKPHVAVYSAGKHNSYGHPHASTITNLCHAGALIYGTAIHGTVIISTSQEDFTVRTTNEAPPQACAQPPVVAATVVP